MRIALGHFESFLLFWRDYIDTNNPLSRCPDVIWHELKCGRNSSELKHRCGLFSWIAWWMFISLNFYKRSPIISGLVSQAHPAFGILDTPAHLQTLEPVVDQIKNNHQVSIICPTGALPPTFTFDFPTSAPSFPISCRLLALTYKGLSLTKQYLQTLGSDLDFKLYGRIAARIYSTLVAIAWSDSLGKANGPLFVTYELLPWQKALVWRWRRCGQRVIHMMHGQRLDFYQHTHATDLVLFSKIDEPWFRARVDPSVRIWTIGHPRLEDVRRQVGPPRETYTGLPRITFFSQPAEGDYSRSRRIADWQICSALLGKAEVRFRAHPREDRAILEADMQAAGIAFMQVSDAGLIEDLKWCDAVASSWSTVSMEAAACGRGIFWTCSTPEKYEASHELRDHGIGVLIQNAPDWTPYLRQWSEGGWRSPVTVSDEQLRELGMIGDTSKSWMERLEIEVATLSSMIEG